MFLWFGSYGARMIELVGTEHTAPDLVDGLRGIREADDFELLGYEAVHPEEMPDIVAAQEAELDAAIADLDDDAEAEGARAEFRQEVDVLRRWTEAPRDAGYADADTVYLDAGRPDRFREAMNGYTEDLLSLFMDAGIALTGGEVTDDAALGAVVMALDANDIRHRDLFLDDPAATPAETVDALPRVVAEEYGEELPRERVDAFRDAVGARYGDWADFRRDFVDAMIGTPFQQDREHYWREQLEPELPVDGTTYVVLGAGHTAAEGDTFYTKIRDAYPVGRTPLDDYVPDA